MAAEPASGGTPGIIYPVILAGGSGTRLWPVSRSLFPKQLLPLHSDFSLLQETAQRIAGPGFARPLVLGNEEHRFIVAEQLRQIDRSPQTIVLEPVSRNTAAAVALAALMLQAIDPAALLLLLPSDHVIGKPEPFLEAVQIAAATARSGRLVTFGITPEHPETGYGYIRAGEPLGDGRSFAVRAFTEKPDRETARRFLTEGGYTWNSGMFLMPAELLISELARWCPALLDQCRRIVTTVRVDGDFSRFDAEAFAALPSLSIDYAVMEHTDRAAVVPADIGWNDIGGWSALWEIGNKDDQGNVILGDVLSEATENCYIRGDGRVIATIGLRDLVIVDTEDALLVAAREATQQVKGIVDRLKRQNRPEHLLHRRVYRPWGWYQTVDVSDRFQVKHINVNPGQSLSLQKHYHRAEHWVVVSGTAEITCDDRTTLLRENESIYIPLGSTHRLANPGRIPLCLIEVQSGSYLGEDDIVRLSDSYGRH